MAYLTWGLSLYKECATTLRYGTLCTAAGSHTPGVIPICMSAAPHTERRLLGALGPMGSG